jgi:FkbM family methyltransferase
MCGRADYVSTDAAADIPLMSAGLRLGWLKVLEAVGVKSFVTTSGLGYNFVCHPGDLANFPFYHRAAYRTELKLCSAWLQAQDHPVAFDVGANGGFFATHLAQMLAGHGAKIFAFEPVPSTFKKLIESVERLRLNGSVYPVAAAVLDDSHSALVSYSKQNSLASQIRPQTTSARVGDQIARVEAITLDEISDKLGTFPNLLKIDVEGSEVAVLRGARKLLARADRPAILFEYNPITLTECGVSASSLFELLAGYGFYYVDDLRGGKLPFGAPLEKPEKIDWICNLFAVPPSESAFHRWEYILSNFKVLSGT